jgi:hypothetical protein
MRYLWVVLAVAVGWSGIAVAQMVVSLPCGAPQGVGKALGKYEERTIGAGIDAQGRIVSLQINPSTGLFTLLMRVGPGLTCLIGGGRNWTAVDPGPADKGKEL